MAEQKADDMMATGTHRAWVGEGIARPGGRAAQDRNWLDRGSGNTRHSAITRSLYSWSNYKSWTEKVRTNWTKDDKDGGKGSK